MTETLAPVSIKASTCTPSITTNITLRGRDGGISVLSFDAAFPPKAAYFSFPDDDRRIEKLVLVGT